MAGCQRSQYCLHSSGRPTLMLDADENTRCIRAKILDRSKFWGSKCHKSRTSNTLRVELMTHFSQRGEATKASVCSSVLLALTPHAPGSAVPRCHSRSVGASGPPRKVTASSRTEQGRVHKELSREGAGSM